MEAFSRPTSGARILYCPATTGLSRRAGMGTSNRPTPGAPPSLFYSSPAQAAIA